MAPEDERKLKDVAALEARMTRIESTPGDESYQPCPRCGTLFKSIADVCTTCLTKDYEEEEDR